MDAETKWEGRQIFGLALVVEGGLVAVAWGLGAALGVPAFGLWRTAWPAALWGAVVGLGLLAAVLAATRLPWGPCVDLRRMIDEVVLPLFADCSPAQLAVISILAGVGEEALFRGVLQTALVPPLGLGPAVLVAGAVFGLAHFISLTYAVYAALVGVFFGGLLVASGNLLAPATAHAVFDFVALVYLTRRRP